MVLKVDQPDNDELNRLLCTTNKVAEAFGQPSLYAKPRSHSKENRKGKRRKGISNNTGGDLKAEVTALVPNALDDLSSCFHISIGWTLTQPEPGKQGSDNLVLRGDTPIIFNVDAVKAKVGNAVSTFSLKAMTNNSRENGIL